jgi:DNA-binding NarL/FixJ family response regulator
VLLADDHPAYRAGIRALTELIDGIEICGEAGGSAEALQRLRRLVPDMLIADISLYHGNGLQLVERAHHEYPELRILVCSMYSESVYGERAMIAGANGYVCKQSSTDELLDAIRRVASGGVYVSDALYRKLLDGNARADPAAANHPESALSQRKLEVFTLMGNGYTTKEIASELSLSTKTVDTHRDHLKKKLHMTDNNRLIRRAVEWVLEASERLPPSPSAEDVSSDAQVSGDRGLHPGARPRVPVARAQAHTE